LQEANVKNKVKIKIYIFFSKRQSEDLQLYSRLALITTVGITAAFTPRNQSFHETVSAASGTTRPPLELRH